MNIEFVSRQEVLNSILDSMNESEELTDEMRELMNDMGESLRS